MFDTFQEKMLYLFVLTISIRKKNSIFDHFHLTIFHCPKNLERGYITTNLPASIPNQAEKAMQMWLNSSSNRAQPEKSHVPDVRRLVFDEVVHFKCDFLDTKRFTFAPTGAFRRSTLLGRFFDTVDRWILNNSWPVTWTQ